MNHLAKKQFVAVSRQPRKLLPVTLGTLAILITQLSGAPQVDLQFWDMVWGPPEYIDTGKALVEQFNRQHPDITVTYRSIPWNNWYQTFVTAIGSGTAPDISTGAGYQAVQLYGQGAILPIDDIIDKWRKSGKLDDFLPRTIDTLKYDGHYVALPWGIDIRIWHYRKDLLEQAGTKPPASWQELTAAAKATTKPNADQYGIVAAGDTGGSHYLYALMLNNGGGLFTRDKKVDLDNERNLEAFALLSQLAKSGYIHPASPGYSMDDALSAFAQGKGAMILWNPGMSTRLPNLADKVGVLQPLAGPHGDHGTIYWVNNIMLYQQSKHPAETKEFLEWWSEHQLDLWTKGHVSQLPVRASFAKDSYFQSNAEIKFILDNYVPIGETTATHAASIFPELNEVEGEGVMQTLVQNLLQGKDVNESVKTAAARVRSIMGQ